MSARSFLVRVAPPPAPRPARPDGPPSRGPRGRVAQAANGELVVALGETREAVPRATGGLLFASGSFARDLRALATEVVTRWRGVPTCIVPCAGVLTERGEVEGGSAAAGLLWSGGRVHALAAAPGEGLAQALARPLEAASDAPAAARRGTTLVFASSGAIELGLLDALGAPELGFVLGGGAVGSPPLVVTASGDVRESPLVGLGIDGLAAPVLEIASAFRLVGPFERVDAASERGLVLTLGGRPALDALSAATPTELPEEQRVLFCALAEGDDPAAPHYFVRPIRGIDEAQRGVLVGRDARVGSHLAFAVRDGAVARAELERAARSAAARVRGAQPRFLLHLTCAGRGRALFGAAEVESRTLRRALEGVPTLGMFGAFELPPRDDARARLALYTSLLALFRSPS
jgi:small ligand-binding sensory domain FIST